MIRVTVDARPPTTATGTLFLFNGCCATVRGSGNGGAGVVPCLEHGEPAAHLQSIGMGKHSQTCILCSLPPTHHDPNSPCSARAQVLESRLARPSGPNARGARRPRRCSNGQRFLPPRWRGSRGSRGQCVPLAQGQGCGRRKRTSARRKPSFYCLRGCAWCVCCLKREIQCVCLAWHTVAANNQGNTRWPCGRQGPSAPWMKTCLTPVNPYECACVPCLVL